MPGKQEIRGSILGGGKFPFLRFFLIILTFFRLHRRGRNPGCSSRCTSSICSAPVCESVLKDITQNKVFIFVICGSLATEIEEKCLFMIKHPVEFLCISKRAYFLFRNPFNTVPVIYNVDFPLEKVRL